MVADEKGKTHCVSRSENLINLNGVLKNADKEPVKIVEADEHLEDSDLMEMVSAGIIPAVVVDNHKAKLWQKIFPELKLQGDVQGIQ